MIKFSVSPIPVPFTTLSYGYGLTDKMTCYGGLNTTSLLFSNLQTELGATFKVFEKENKWGISSGTAMQLAYNLRNKTGFRIWPSFDINAYYHIKNKGSFIYGGFSTWLELTNTKAFNEKQQQRAIPNLQFGCVHVKSKWMNQFEIKYLSIGTPNLPGVVDYIGISGKGTLGIYYSLIRKF